MATSRSTSPGRGPKPARHSRRSASRGPNAPWCTAIGDAAGPPAAGGAGTEGAGPGAGAGAAGSAGAGCVPEGCGVRLRLRHAGRLRDLRRLRFCAAASALGLAGRFLRLRSALTGAQPGLGLRRLRFRLAAATALTSAGRAVRG